MTKPTIKSPVEKPSLTVRSAEPEDRLLCSQLDGVYQTNYVWQMHFQESRRVIDVTFNRVRLRSNFPSILFNQIHPPRKRARASRQ